MDMPVSLPSDKLIEIQQFVSLCYWGYLFRSIRLCFLVRPHSVPMDMHSVACHSEQHVECLPFSSSFIVFFFQLPFQHSISFRDSLGCRVLSLCNFIFLMCFLLQMLHPITGPFYFQGFPYPVVLHGQLLCTKFVLPCKTLGWCAHAM